MQVPTDKRRRDATVDSLKQKLNFLTIRTLRWEPFKKHVVHGTPLEGTAFEHNTKHLEQQGFSRAEEPANPDPRIGIMGTARIAQIVLMELSWRGYLATTFR